MPTRQNLVTRTYTLWRGITSEQGPLSLSLTLQMPVKFHLALKQALTHPPTSAAKLPKSSIHLSIQAFFMFHHTGRRMTNDRVYTMNLSPENSHSPENLMEKVMCKWNVDANYDDDMK